MPGLFRTRPRELMLVKKRLAAMGHIFCAKLRLINSPPSRRSPAAIAADSIPRPNPPHMSCLVCCAPFITIYGSHQLVLDFCIVRLSDLYVTL